MNNDNIIEETPLTPEQELRAAEEAASVEQRRRAHETANADIVAGYRQILKGLQANLDITESGDLLARRAEEIATSLGTTTTARPLGHPPWRALLLEAMAGEQQTWLALPELLRIIPGAQERAHAVNKVFNNGVGLNVSGPSGRMTPEDVAAILLDTLDLHEPRRRQTEADAPVLAALAAEAEREVARERELEAARKWKTDTTAKLMHEARQRSSERDGKHVREEKQRSAVQKREAEDAELAEFRAALMAEEVSAVLAAQGVPQ